MSGTPLQPALTLAALALMALALTACGAPAVSTGGYAGEQKAVAQRISDFQSDVTASDQKKVCADDLAVAVKARLRTAAGTRAVAGTAAGACESALKSQLSQIDTLDLTIKSIKAQGSAAHVRVQSTWSGRSRESTLALVKEGGVWRISALQ
jgi:hypothetical protein